MRRILSLLFIVFISFGLMGLNQIPQNYTIRVGFYENAPKIYTASDGTISGFWPEIINYIAKKEAWQIVWVPGTWEEGLQRLESGEIDMMPDVGWTAERAEKYAFTNESIMVSWSRVYSGDKLIQTILDLDGKKIAGLNVSVNFDGPEGIKILATKFDINCQFVGFKSYTEVFEAIQKNEVDAGVTNKDFGDLNESKYGLTRNHHHSTISNTFCLSKKSELTQFLITTIDNDIKPIKRDSNLNLLPGARQFHGGKTG